jgi:hypothetical protein
VVDEGGTREGEVVDDKVGDDPGGELTT